MKRIFFVLTLFSALFIFSACATTQEKPVRVRDETYIADINPFIIDTFHYYASRKMGKPKICDFTFSFAPRTNILYVTTRIGINYIRVGFTYKERMALLEIHDKYIEELNAGLIKNEKPTKKNAYSKSAASVEWGTMGITYETIATYMTNTYFLEQGKPYFRFYFVSTECQNEEDKGTSSPPFYVYLSPAQWEKIIQVCQQDLLVSRTDEILAEANEF